MLKVTKNKKRGIMINKSIISILSIFLLSCSSVQVTDYQKEKPELILEKYLNGPIEAHGVFRDRKGLVVKRFQVKMTGTWNNNIGILDEDFSYSDGTKGKRVWTIKKISNSRYIGTASDVVGEAIGEVSGNALLWKYKLKLPVDGKEYIVDFEDWMYLMDDKVMLNVSDMSKWGFHLGTVTLTFIKGESKN